MRGRSEEGNPLNGSTSGVWTIVWARFADASTRAKAESAIPYSVEADEFRLRIDIPLASSAIVCANELAQQYHARVGVATGEGGHAAESAAAALDMADPGQVVATLGTVELARPTLASGLRFADVGSHPVGRTGGRVRLFLLTEKEAPRRTIDRSHQALFLGRTRELLELRRRLDEGRMVTVVGPTGIGKTALLHRFAIDVEDEFPDGVWPVDLSGVEGGSQALATICTALEVDRGEFRLLSDALSCAVAGKRVLLILDGIESCAEVVSMIATQLLLRAPDLQILCSGLQGLRTKEERLMSLRGLDVPEPNMPVELMEENDAFGLFLDRAQSINRSQKLRDRDVRDIAEICRQLDGHPLAIELAANRVGALTPHQILGRLEDRLAFLKDTKAGRPARHASLRAAVERDLGALPDGARSLIARLSVFRGAFGLEAAVGVCATDDLDASMVETGFDELIERGLLLPSPKSVDERFFFLSDTYRLASRELLVKLGAVEQFAARRNGWVEAICERSLDEINGTERDAWLIRLEAFYEDAREVVRGLQKRHPDKAGRIAFAYFPVLYRRGYFQEGIDFYQEILQQPKTVASSIYPRLLNGLAIFLQGGGQKDAARQRALQSYFLAKQLANHEAESSALNTIGMLAYGEKRFGVARGCFARSAEISRQLGDTNGMLLSLSNFAISRQGASRERVRHLLEDGMRRAEAIGNNSLMAGFANALAENEVLFGDPRLGLRYASTAWAVYGADEDPLGCQRIARTITKLFARAGDAAEAIRWYGFAESISDAQPDPLRKDGDLLAEYGLSAQFTEEEVRSLMHDGRMWTYEESLKLVNRTL